MFLSKVTLVSSTQSAIELAKLAGNGVYASHQLLWRLFPNEDERNFLYREEQGDNGRPVFFVLSEKQPKSLDTIFEINTKPFNPQLEIGTRLAFKLRVNPTICITDNEGKSRRHDVVMHAKTKAKSANINDAELKVLMEQAAINWISDEKRLDQWGITLDCVPDIESYEQHASQKRHTQGIKFSSVNFQGLLTIADPDLFLKKYKQGFGRAKSLGCGLMLIRRV